MSSYTSKKRERESTSATRKRQKKGGRKGRRKREGRWNEENDRKKREGTNNFLLDNIEVTKPQTPYSENWQQKERIKYISGLS